jgi:ribosome biogenesis GTPase / thiamine phosphate phosphatase
VKFELAELGWDERWAAAFAPHAATGLIPARVGIEFNHIYRLFTDEGEINAQQAGRMLHRAGGRHELAAVGDWVAVKKTRGERSGTIDAILPRRSKFSRKVAGELTEEQVVAANIDTVFLVMGLDHDYNPRRLERYLLMSYESGATPVILLSKADVADDLPAQVAEVAAIAPGTPVHAVAAKPKRAAPGFDAAAYGVDIVRQYLGPGRTGTLLGSSGVGKSTLINALVGSDMLKTKDVRASDSRGRHTTRHRQLIVLPGTGLLIDTPGMRELQLWVADSAKESFEDIEELAAGCHFGNCRHRDEPRCAVKRAVEEGGLTPERFASFLKLQDEMEALDARKDVRAQIDEKRRGKITQKSLKQLYKDRARD